MSAQASTSGSAPPSPEPKAFVARRGIFLAGCIIVLAALAVYYNSLSSPFIFDDRPAIADNPAIHHLWSALLPPRTGGGVIGRPLVNFSLAVNYALGGMQAWGYHAMNIAIHILAGLTLFGLVRRTLLRPAVEGLRRARAPAPNQGTISQQPSFADSATLLAFAVALLWTVHPLQTESVTCIIQRTESLMSLFYLLTLYCFVRGTEGQEFCGGPSTSSGHSTPKKTAGHERRPKAGVEWYVLSIIACALGMATKEVMVSAPLIVLLYDRTFVAGTFREAWRRRGGWHLGLFGTWLLLGYLVVSMGGSRNTSAGFGLGVTPWTYALTQCRAIVLYLKLAVWPHPLVFYYGTDLVQHAATVAPQAVFLILLVGWTIFLLRRQPVLGFMGAWFFLILAPSSSVLPLITQTMAEHRMYLPLAAVIALVVLGLYSLIGPRSVIVFAAMAVGLGCLTIQRNKDYRSELAIWTDTAAKRPDNARAHSNLGTLLEEIPGRLPDAIAEYKAALRINPGLAGTHYNLGHALAKVPGHMPDAIVEYRAALRIDPGLTEAHYSLGNALLPMKGGLPEAITEYEAVLKGKPDYLSARINLGSALAQIPGRLPEAIAQYETALQINPASFEAHCNLGDALAQIPGRLPEAASEYETALRGKPDSAEAHFNLGSILSRIPGRLPDAIAEYETALRIKPDFEQAHTNLGIVLANIPGRLPEAISHFEAAVQINPDSPEAQNNLRLARQALEKSQDARH